MDRVGNNDAAGHWLSDHLHRTYLVKDAYRALDFFDASPRPAGGFHALGLTGTPLPDTTQELHVTTRLVHCYALAQLAGRPDTAGIVDQGMAGLWQGHRDQQHGGYLWSVDVDGVKDGTKLAYGHVFVLLAASSAKLAGHPDADRLLTDVSEILDRHYWDEDRGVFRDEFTRDWQPFSTYRGMNANMHGTEALLAAYEATGEAKFLNRAKRILAFFIDGQATANDWQIPEHYKADWTVDRDYSGNPMFRPAGTTPGHSFEMARLLLQYWDLAGRPGNTAPAQARALVAHALRHAWDQKRGGLVYTLQFDGTQLNRSRYWWPVTEAIGVLASLIKLEGRDEDEIWYRRLWEFADSTLIDHKHGGWVPELDNANRPANTQFNGKPDIYHALQADLFPLVPGLSRMTDALARLRPLA